ncbi:MAG: alpha/beta hydrolase [Flavobacteriaceae bacterium]|nr:alpha/beta hydrolase [Flavobacteriaceae bacterium]
MIIEKNRILRTSGERPIVYDIYHNGSGTAKPVVIFCHGFKGFKDWGAWDLVAKEFAATNFFFIKFNFSHNGGTPEQPIDFPDLEAFAKNNYSKELEDLERVLQFISTSIKYDQDKDVDNISLIGHSRGGGIALLKAAESEKVTKLATWASVSDFRSRFDESSPEFLAWKRSGRRFIKNGRTNQMMPQDWQFYEDFIEHQDQLDIKHATQNLNIPHLIVHGEEDTTVSVASAKDLKKWNPSAELQIFPNTGHVFDTHHPWNGMELPLVLAQIVKKTASFLHK